MSSRVAKMKFFKINQDIQTLNNNYNKFNF